MSMSADYRGPRPAPLEGFEKMGRAPSRLPRPLVHFKAHPLQFVRNLVILVGVGLIFAHIGTLIVTGLYYLLTQTNHTVKHAWDHALNTSWWPTWRHMIRDVGEGVLGGTLAQLITFNHYKKRNLKTKRNVFDRLEGKLHIPNIKDCRPLSAAQYVAFPLLVIIYAIPGFLVGAGVFYLINHVIASAHHAAVTFTAVTHVQTAQPSTWARIQTIWTGSVSQKIVGLFASVFLARRVGKKYYSDIQDRFIDRRLALGKGLAFYHPPNFRARYNDLSGFGNGISTFAQVQAKERHAGGGAVPTLLTVGSLVGLGLAGVGFYVLTYIAQ